MKPETMSLFEREMRDQIASARETLMLANTKGDPLLALAAQAHLDGLVDLARRNGIGVGDVQTHAERLASEPA